METPIHVGAEEIQLPVLGKVRLFEHGYIPQDREQDKPDRKAEKKRHHKQRDVNIVVTYKSAVISEQAGHWFVAVLVEETIPDSVSATGEPVGVDLGLKTLAVCSDGMEIVNPHALKTNLKKLKCSERCHSKRKKGSKNKQKSKRKLVKVHYRIGNIRENALHQATAKITAKAKPSGLNSTGNGFSVTWYHK